MSLAVFHSLPEALLYMLMILLLILNIVGLAVGASNTHQVKVLAAQNQKLAATSQQQISCIASFFLIPGGSRATTSLNALANKPACKETIKSIE